MPGLTALLFNLRNAAEFSARGKFGLLSRHSAFDQLFHFLFEVLANLLGEILL